MKDIHFSCPFHQHSEKRSSICNEIMHLKLQTYYGINGSERKTTTFLLFSHISCVTVYTLVYLTLPLLRYSMCRIQQPVLSLNPGNMNITPILNSLHWLPVVNRIKFKILLLVFKIKHGFAPTYLMALSHLPAITMALPLRPKKYTSVGKSAVWSLRTIY